MTNKNRKRNMYNITKTHKSCFPGGIIVIKIKYYNTSNVFTTNWNKGSVHQQQNEDQSIHLQAIQTITT